MENKARDVPTGSGKKWLGVGHIPQAELMSFVMEGETTWHRSQTCLRVSDVCSLERASVY